MRKMNSAEFRQWFTKLDEAVEVTKYNDRSIGTWFPSTVKLPPAEAPTALSNIELPQRPDPLTHAFTPVPKPGSKSK